MAGREMEGKAGLHPGGRAGGLRAPGAGGGNPSPLVCGAGVRVGGADPRLLLGGRGVSPRGKSGSSGGPQRKALSTRVLTPPPGGLAPAPRPRPPGPPFHPRARCSAGGGIGWGRGAEAAAGTTSLPAASLCARGASGGGERASEQQPERAVESERVGEGARRRPRLRSPASRQLCPSTARRARRPAAAAAAAAAASAGAPPAAVAGRGLVRAGVPSRGLGHPGAAERRGARRGRQSRRSARSLNCVGRRALGLQGAPRAGCPDFSGEPQFRGASRASAPQPHRTLRSSPAYPTSTQTFLTPSPVGVAESAGLPVGLLPRRTLATLDLLPLVASVATSPGRAGHGTPGERGNDRCSPKAPAPPGAAGRGNALGDGEAERGLRDPVPQPGQDGAQRRTTPLGG